MRYDHPIALAGLFILLLAAAAMLLPLARAVPGAILVGSLLLLAGLAEMLAGRARSGRRSAKPTSLAGIATAVAGLIVLAYPYLSFFPLAYVVIAWLLVRGGILLSAARRWGTQRATWPAVNGTVDLLLAGLLVIGLPIAGLVVAMFGTTPEIVSSFALILAASFLATGATLLATTRQ